MKAFDSKLSRQLAAVQQKIEQAKTPIAFWYWRWRKCLLEKKIPKENQ